MKLINKVYYIASIESGTYRKISAHRHSKANSKSDFLPCGIDWYLQGGKQ